MSFESSHISLHGGVLSREGALYIFTGQSDALSTSITVFPRLVFKIQLGTIAGSGIFNVPGVKVPLVDNIQGFPLEFFDLKWHLK